MTFIVAVKCGSLTIVRSANAFFLLTVSIWSLLDLPSSTVLDLLLESVSLLGCNEADMQHSRLIISLLYPATRLVIGRVYKKLDEVMKLLWNKDLKLNTVHIRDVVRACWHLAKWYDENGAAVRKSGYPIFNLADKQDTGTHRRHLCLTAPTNFVLLNRTVAFLDQETINQHLESIFGIKTGYHGTIISSFAKVMKMSTLTMNRTM